MRDRHESSAEWEEFSQCWPQLLTQTEMAQSWFGAPFRPKTADNTAMPPGDAATAMTELWRSWIALSGSLAQAAPPSATAPLDPVSLSLLGGSHVGQAIRRLTQGPQFADAGTTERRMAKLTELWLEVQAATRGYEQVISEAWMLASQRFGTALAERHRPGGDALAPKEAARLWLDIADRTLMETHRSEGFLAAQRRLLRSGIDFLLAERELVESVAEPAGLPTRTEIDEVHRSVQELKRRVRTLEKGSLRAERAAPDAGTPGASAMTPGAMAQGDQP
jgi:polyhydroxyalkanoate synthase subunit PhaE